MKQQTVVIKSNKYGITLFLDKNVSFRELTEDVAEKFKASSGFFKNAKMALAFEGRFLSREEQMELIRTIQDNSDVEIVCVLEQDSLKEAYMKKALEEREKTSSEDGRFYKGTLRSGQVLESAGRCKSRSDSGVQRKCGRVGNPERNRSCRRGRK